MRIIYFICISMVLFSFSSCKSYKLQAPDAYEQSMQAMEDIVVVDVRTEVEMAEGHIEGAILADIKKDTFDEVISPWDRSKTYFIYCLGGVRSQTALARMRAAGFKNIHELKGGFKAWKAAGKPVVK